MSSQCDDSHGRCVMLRVIGARRETARVLDTFLFTSIAICNTFLVREESGDGTIAPAAAEIEAFQIATRDLVGLALRSLEVIGGEVRLPQLRLLLVLGDLEPCPSARVAEALGLGASSVTRLADRLVGSGHVTRGSDPANRSVVTLALSDRGRRVVAAVLRARAAEFERVLARLSPEVRAATAAGLRELHRVVGKIDHADMLGPVPL